METMMVAEQKKVVDTYVTEGYLRKLFNRSGITIELWRKNRGLPFVVIPGDDRDAIRYELNDVLEWAKLHGAKTYKVPNRKGR